MRFAVVLLLVLLQSACAYSPRGSDEWWFDKMQRDHRSQCNLLPPQVKAQCLERQAGSYAEFLKQQKNKQQQATAPASESESR